MEKIKETRWDEYVNKHVHVRTLGLNIFSSLLMDILYQLIVPQARAHGFYPHCLPLAPMESLQHQLYSTKKDKKVLPYSMKNLVVGNFLRVH